MSSGYTVHDNYTLLIQKLDEFRRKFYINRLLRGLIFLLSISLISFLVLIFSEFIGHFSIPVRTILFYFYIMLNLAVLVYYVIIPLIKIYKPGKSLSYKQASLMIGRFFPEVKDKLLNTLELKEMSDNLFYSRSLIEASINQRIEELKPIPFSFAINLGENKKYLKYLLIPVFIFTILIFTTPKVITESTERIVRHNVYYKKPAPFEFLLLNKKLEAVRNEDFTIQVKVSGKTKPANVFIQIGSFEYLMRPKKNEVFEYTLKNIREPLKFYFFSGNVKSETYRLGILPKPTLKNMTVDLIYPSYLGKKSEQLKNTGDLTIPEGTKIIWNFVTEDAERMIIDFEGQFSQLNPIKKNIFSLSKVVRKNLSYSFRIANSRVSANDTLKYYISVIPDAYPRIEVSRQFDSSNNKYVFFTGEVADDYGFKKLYFVYHFTETTDSSKSGREFKIPVNVPLNSNYLNFYYSVNLDDLKVSHDESLEYFFEIWDNDGVNGSKSARSQRFLYAAPSEKEMKDMAQKSAEDLKKDMQKAITKTNEIQKEIQETQKKLIEKNKLDWDDKKRIQELINKQKDLLRQVEEMKEKYIENVQKQDDYFELNKELLEKYRELYEKFEEIMPEEIKKLYEELEKLLEQNNKEGIQQELDKLKKDQKSLEKELDRMLELFKRLEFENKLDNITQKLDELSQKQEKLSEETEKTKDKEATEKKQEELNKEFKDLKEEFKELEKLNENLEKPNNLEDTKEDQQQIEKEQQNSLDQMQQKNMKQAAQSQKNASRKMKELSEKMKSMKMEMEMKSLEINYEKLRRILENLLHVSFEQEALAEQFKSINTYNPKYVELTQKQKKLKDDMKLIEDSLFALSKVLPMIESFVNKEVENINYQMSKTLELLAERIIPEARTRQGYTLTSINNLAVMLSELLKQMQQEMSDMQSSGKKSMKKKSKGSLPDLQKLQEQLSKQIQEMKQQGNKPGQNPSMSKQLAEMAARQEMLRNAIRQLQKEMGAGDKSNDELNKALQELQKLLEENEKDLVEGKITEKTIRRQQEIKVKFLEAEKAEKKQDEEERRESKTAKDIFNRKPPSLEEYIKNKNKEIELLQAVPPELTPFYKNKVKEYFRLLPN